MKTRKLFIAILAWTVTTGLMSCDDFLDREPKSKIAPETYFNDASQMRAYCDALYSDILPSHGTGNTYGIFKEDAGTDNQIDQNVHKRYTDNLWKVPNKEDSDWEFTQIYKCNFFLANILPKYGESLDGRNNTIEGDLAEIKHYLGEIYFLRACEYFKRYQMFGDFPIITAPLPDNMEALTQASKRMPRNEVARFIVSDLDKAIILLGEKTMPTIRIGKDAAILLKSRVALFEGTWLKYFKGSAFVPGGEGWPGATKEYNASYQYPNGNIDNEINYFLDLAMEASKTIAEAYKDKLTNNTGYLQQSSAEDANPYYNMFAQENLSSVSEVLLWRQYVKNLTDHNVNVEANLGNQQVGVTRGYIQNYLMSDGTPVYTHGTYADGDGYYMGDKEIANVRRNRDSRLAIFLKEPGQKNILYEDPVGTQARMIEPIPDINNSSGYRYTTGYALRKGGSFDQKHYLNSHGYTAAISYRATEALLNYMEASYERNGTLDASASEYWQIIRRRAHVSDDINLTISATIMNEEAPNDWGAYSAGKLLTDKILYNIRRERRSELIAEGLRYMDLRRWRSIDQLITTVYQVEGMHLWNTPMQGWYNNLLADGSDKAVVSSPTLSEYLRPYQKNSRQDGYKGLTWKMAHYLTPIMVNQFLLTAEKGKGIETSPIYQNPYWPIEADQSAER